MREEESILIKEDIIVTVNKNFRILKPEFAYVEGIESSISGK
ncbi:MAG: hypothetical protein ACTSYM_06785 [Candidatus Baldrarchaeia archaeon]